MQRWACCLASVVCLVGVAFLAEPATQKVADAGQEVRRTLERGEYEKAERLAVEWHSRVQAAHGSDSIELARASDLLVEALLENGKAAASSTLVVAERVIAAKERALGRDSVELAVSLHNLGTLRGFRGEFRAALTLFERALSVRRGVLAPETSQIADSLDAIGATMIRLDRFALAQERLDESLKIREQQSVESPLRLARTLASVGNLQFRTARYRDAASVLDRALDLWNRHAPSHPDKVTALITSGAVTHTLGDIRGGHRLWTEAVALARQQLGGDHPLVARAEIGLAHATHALGDFVEARRLREDAVRIGSKSLTSCDPDVADQLNDLSNSLVYFRDFVSAQRMLRRKLSIVESCRASADSVATTLINLFHVAKEMGAMREAERFGNRAVRVWSDAFGPAHPFVAFGLADIASFEALRKNYPRAQSLFERALRIRREAFGPNHPVVAETLANFASMLGESGRMVLAVRSVQEAVEILTATPAQNPDALARALLTRAALQQRQGDYTAAQASLVEAVAARERLHGAAHPVTAEAAGRLGAAAFALGSYETALARGLAAEQARRDLLRFTVRSLPEQRAMEFAATRVGGLDLVLSIVAAGQVNDTSRVLDEIVRSRGVILDELAARTRVTAAGDPALATLTKSLATARERYASLMLRTFEGAAVDSVLLDGARQEKERAEEALAEQSAAARAELADARAGVQDIQRALPPGSALVSFSRYDRTTFTKNGKEKIASRVTPSYMAFVARADAAPIVAVPIGSAAALETAIAGWRAAVSTPAHTEPSYRLAGGRLRARVWDPVAEHLRDVAEVFIVPDGAVSTVSFASLPVAANKYLIETGPVIHYFSTERDLIADTPATGRGLLAVGGPTYGPQALATAGGKPSAPVQRSACIGSGALTFEDLPGSRVEVQDIARLWASRGANLRPRPGDGGSAGDGGLLVLSGASATKAAVVRAAAGRRVVHFATHGFFLGSSCDPRPANTRGVGGLVAASTKRPSVENPLLLAGLAFAGANRETGARRTNGILTAEEVVGLNLQGAEWAVLSACDTGLGEIKAGEGVFGLRRAFQIAGVRTVIMSLWSVEDQATRTWMRALYEGRLRQHLTTAKAVRAAGLRVLTERRARGLGAHPFYWAAFVAAGDWR